LEIVAGLESWALSEDFVWYDMVKIKSEILLLATRGRSVIFERINLDKIELSLNGINKDKTNFVVFEEGWAKAHVDALPIIKAHIVPVDGGAYLFFEAKTGNHFMWEVSKKEAHLVWKRAAIRRCVGRKLKI
jgi:hypothetical protein